MVFFDRHEIRVKIFPKFKIEIKEPVVTPQPTVTPQPKSNVTTTLKSRILEIWYKY